MNHKTEMKPCRSWPMEFTTTGNSTAMAQPPWYVIRISDPTIWGDREWYSWHDYGGPPTVYLTRRRAEKRARELREQLGRTATIETVRVDPTE